MADDPYEVLGVDRDATDEEINAAYKKAAKQAHPDAGGTTEDFTRVKGAAMVLLDKERRKKFDETGRLDGGHADNTMAAVMEAIANFFINSIDATDNFGAPSLSQVNLVEAATTHFKNQIHGAQHHIKETENKIKKYDRAIKRLKSKRQDDPISDMLRHHANLMRGLANQTEAQIKQFEMALEILKGYEFEPDASSSGQQNAYGQRISQADLQRAFGTGYGRGFFST